MLYLYVAPLHTISINHKKRRKERKLVKMSIPYQNSNANKNGDSKIIIFSIDYKFSEHVFIMQCLRMYTSQHYNAMEASRSQ